MSQIDAFRNALEYCQLEDLGFQGHPFTWSNKRPGCANTKVRLDRAVANKEWIDKYQMSNVTHLSSHASDHLPIILQVQCYKQQRHRRGKGFKFEESWLLWEECENVVMEAWHNVGDKQIGLATLKEKIKKMWRGTYGIGVGQS